MARPHIEFIQAQRLPWQTDALGPARRGIDVKVLSRDAVNGEVSAIVRYPSGYAAEPGILGVDEEFFLLDGTFRHGTTAYGPDCYGFWPKGMTRSRVISPTGAVVLTFLSGPLTEGDAASFDARRLVEKIDIRDGEWKADLAAMGLTVMAATSKIRRLRSEPGSGEITYVTATIPYWRETQSERHPVIQEIYVLSGETYGNCGIMKPGAYTWRPENVSHGPYGSTTGAVFFFRSRGGALTTEHDPPKPFRFEAPHRPVLPPELAALGATPIESASRY